VTLIFPAVNPAAAEYLNAARTTGEPTVCAASVACGEITAEWGELHLLPSIYDSNFPELFLSLVVTHSIAHLFCPISSVHIFMRRLIEEYHLNISSIGESPIRQPAEQHRQPMDRARRLLPLVELCTPEATLFRPYVG